MIKKNSLEFKKVSIENLIRFSEMMELSLGLIVDENYFEWKYIKNPAGEVIAFEALDGEKSVGFYGVIPEWYIVNGEKIKIYQSMDTMVHPDYRRRGLFTSLANMTYDYINQYEDNTFIIGIPGMNSLPGFVQKLNWQNIHNFDYVFNHRVKFNLQMIGKKNKSITLQKLQKFDHDFDIFIATKYQSPKAITKFLSKEILNWKILLHPYHQYYPLKVILDGKVIGYLIYRILDEKRCFIDYFDLVEENLLNQYTNNIIQELFKLSDASFIYTWKNTSPILQRTYSKSGFIKNPYKKGPFSYKVPFIVYSNKKEINGIDCFNIENFDIQPILQD